MALPPNAEVRISLEDAARMDVPSDVIVTIRIVPHGWPALGAGERELHMVLTSEGVRVRGFAGCTRFTGSYQQTERQLCFKPLAATRMVCLEGTEQEQRFLEALGEVVRFTINGHSLALYTGMNGCFSASRPSRYSRRGSSRFANGYAGSVGS